MQRQLSDLFDVIKPGILKIFDRFSMISVIFAPEKGILLHQTAGFSPVDSSKDRVATTIRLVLFIRVKKICDKISFITCGKGE